VEIIETAKKATGAPGTENEKGWKEHIERQTGKKRRHGRRGDAGRRGRDAHLHIEGG